MLLSGVLTVAQAFPGDALYFISSRDGNYRIYTIDLSHNVTRKLHNQPVGYDITLSPDGSRIAFIGFTRQSAALYVMDWNGKNLNVISQPAGQRPANPLWSPDSQQLVFTLRDNNQVEVNIIQADGSGQRRLPIEPPEAEKQLLAWSPDGKHIAFRNLDNRQSIIQIIQADGSQAPLPVTEAITATWAQWSPDGKQMVYVAAPAGGNEGRVYVQNAECVGAPTRHTCSPMLLGETQTQGLYDQALWSPNNRYILLHSARTRLPASRHIYVMDTKGSQWRQLTNSAEQEFAPAWSPRGERVAYVTGAGNSSPKLFIAALDGRVEQLSNDLFSYYSPEWWPG